MIFSILSFVFSLFAVALCVRDRIHIKAQLAKYDESINFKTYKMENTNQIITDEQINKAWGHASFGDASKRDVIANSLLKYASGYSTGYTANYICKELGLITKGDNLTTLGKRYLFAAYSNGQSF